MDAIDDLTRLVFVTCIGKIKESDLSYLIKSYFLSISYVDIFIYRSDGRHTVIFYFVLYTFIY